MMLFHLISLGFVYYTYQGFIKVRVLKQNAYSTPKYAYCERKQHTLKSRREKPINRKKTEEAYE